MNINKAIRKQNKSYKRFSLSMCFVFLSLPIALFLYKNFHIFYIAYLILVEILILLAIVLRMNRERLDFYYDVYRIRLKQGLWLEGLNILCDKVAFVHVEEEKKDEDGTFNIILISSSKFRSKKMLPINFQFLKSHSYVAHQYNKLKSRYPEDGYYYLIIKSGRYKKYKLIDTIYKSCVYAHFSEEAVEKVKYYRQNSN